MAIVIGVVSRKLVQAEHPSTTSLCSWSPNVFCGEAENTSLEVVSEETSENNILNREGERAV